MTSRVYPLIIKMKTKEVQVGSVKVHIDTGIVVSRSYEEHDVTLEEINIQYKEGDFLTKVLTPWS